MSDTATTTTVPAATPASEDDADSAPERPPPAAGGTLDIDLIDANGRLAAGDGDWIAEMLHRAAAELDAAGELRVRVVDDAEMAAAHERWSGVAGTTDVLTFDLRDDAADPIDTDVLVCLDEAERRAAERTHPARAELLLYALHALLHCMGYDDTTDEAFASMHAREDEVLEAIGVGALFAAEPGDGKASETSSRGAGS